ncbi:hypothetical protein HPB52_019205 [Rhipicephalus sanguineus]|uniref:Nlr family card domain protein n=1 Tax=Rhipicephalus sanguineus TaxID=34632 RepID=A0A9D4Q7K2_RHISA|nr:hypothetical protein HPB52_019205 [Rhipicephalus sanguineus]
MEDINHDIPATGDALLFSSNQWAELEGATGWLTGAVVDYHSPCSVTPDRPCHIVGKLVALNELLFPSRVQLQEIPGTRGLLALGSINDSVPSMAEPPDLRLRQSTSLMRRLLKHHKCISTLYVGPLHFQQYMSLICDALPYSRLKKLRLVCSDRLMCENGCAALSSLTSLEELDCSFINVLPSSFSRYISAEFPTALAALVRASHSLGVLRIEGIIMEEHATKNLLLYLTESGALKDVTLGRRVVPETCREELAHFLMFAPSLASFSFEADCENTEIAVLEGVLYNTTVSKLRISYFTAHTQSVQLVARILSENTAIRSLHIHPNCVEASPLQDIAYDTWLEALRKNETLEELFISLQIWNAQQWTRFSAILLSKCCLKKVILSSASQNRHLLTHLCHALEGNGVHDRVSYGTYYVKDHIDLLKCTMFSGLYLLSFVPPHVKAAALQRLRDHEHLTYLRLNVPRGNLALSSALAEYIQSTSVLRKLELSTVMVDAPELDPPDVWWRVIVQSLSRNNSIKELVLHIHEMSDSGVESLADAVKQSTNIRKLAYLGSGTTSVSAFVNRLSVDIMDNHTLLGVLLQGQMDQGWLDASKKVFTIYEATRRNSDLLAAAAAFTKSTELDRRSTAALERIYKLHAELLEDLAELVEVNVAEIGGMVDRHLKRTASLDEYMRITGVVKEQVVCHPRHDGCTQLDDLHEDCWEMVRRYLMLDDVEEVVTHLENR